MKCLYVTETRKGLCFTNVRNGQCVNPSGMLATKSSCCCSMNSKEAAGEAWGSPCEICPSMSAPEYIKLCPHGPGKEYNGHGKQLADIWIGFTLNE